MNGWCKVCGSSLTELIRYDNMPNGAQNFLSSPNQPDKGITIILCQCNGCGLVQIPATPVEYYKEAHRTKFWMNSDWRKKQIEEFIKTYGLENKRVKTINSEPGIEKYEAFLMFNYLEHFPYPSHVLARICSNLEWPGVGIVEVPNFDMIHQEDIFSEIVIDHLFYFTKDTLTFTLASAGLEVISTRLLSSDFILSATVCKRAPYHLSNFKDQEEIVRKELQEYIKDFKSIAVWGAGHQGLMLLQLMNIKDKVAYVVDSATKKQGKYTQITHLPIVSPDMLRTKPVDMVLVLVGGFYTSVLEQLAGMGLNPLPKIAMINKSELEIVNDLPKV